MPNYCVIICSACDANATARNILLSYPPILSVDERDQSYDAKSKPVMQMRSRPPIRNQLMHLLHHNIVRLKLIIPSSLCPILHGTRDRKSVVP